MSNLQHPAITMAMSTGYPCSPAELEEQEEEQLRMEMNDYCPTKSDTLGWLKMKVSPAKTRPVADFIEMLNSAFGADEAFDDVVAEFAEKYREEITRWVFL